MQRIADVFWYCCTVFWWCAFLVFLAAACCPANAAPPLVITEGGYYSLEVGPDGVPQNVPFDTVIDLRGGGDPDEPDPPPDPDKPDLDELTKTVKAWAEAVEDPLTAQRLSLLYLQIAQSVEVGDLDLETGPIALSAAGDAITTAQWDTFRESVASEFTMRRQRDLISAGAHFVGFLEAVAEGLKLSADGSVAVELEDLLQVVTKVNTAIDGARK